MGTFAFTLVTRPGFTARVVAASRPATYLCDGAAEILWLAPSFGVRHRRAILLDYARPALGLGSVVSVAGGRLVAGGTAFCDLNDVSVWEPAPIWPEFAMAGDRFADRVRAAARIARSYALDAPVLRAICRVWLGQEPAIEVADELDPFAAQALPALVATARSLSSDLAAPLAGFVDRLIGLGPGLTPSGDDVLGGLLFALACMGLDCSHLIGPDERRTHPISLAIVRDLGHGHGPEPLHRLAHELLDPHSGVPTPATIAGVVAIGHRSGRDLLAGFLLGLCAGLAWPPIDSGSQTRSWAWQRI
jgi:hypothetical protein